MARDSVPSILRVYHTVNSTTQMPSTMLKYESCVEYSLLVHTAYATVMMAIMEEAADPLNIPPNSQYLLLTATPAKNASGDERLNSGV